MKQGIEQPFEERAFLDFTSASTVMLCTLGERLGLFRAMSAGEAFTSDDLAKRTGTDARYVREWLSGMACAGYIGYDATTESFELSEEQAQVLTIEKHPSYLGAHYEALSHLLPNIYDHLVEAFVSGAGVPASTYPPALWNAQRRANSATYETTLVQEWIPLSPALEQKMSAGARVADIGCGAGEAVVSMAKAFPSSTFVGMDVVPENIRLANESVEGEEIEGRVSFQIRDVTDGLGADYDIVTAFDVIHDLPHPAETLAAIAGDLPEGGLFFVQDTRAAETFEGNAGPLGALQYTISLFNCMSISLGEGGVGLGTLGLPVSKLRALASNAGFTTVEEIPIDDPLAALYLLRV